jgi:tetratricopeptide (TPR) repeat protein
MQYTQPDSCLALLENLEFERSDELSPTNRAIVYYYQGNIYWYLQKLNTSILFYKKCLKEADQNDDSLRVVVVLSDIGYVFSDQDKNDSAIYYLHNSAIVVSPRIPSIIILIFSSEL